MGAVRQKDEGLHLEHILINEVTVLEQNICRLQSEIPASFCILSCETFLWPRNCIAVSTAETLVISQVIQLCHIIKIKAVGIDAASCCNLNLNLNLIGDQHVVRIIYLFDCEHPLYQ